MTETSKTPDVDGAQAFRLWREVIVAAVGANHTITQSLHMADVALMKFLERFEKGRELTAPEKIAAIVKEL